MTRLDTGFSSADESPGFLLWKAANQLQRAHTKCLVPLGLTPSQFSVMACLVYLRQSGPVTATRIIDHAGLDKMLVSDMVRALERKKLLERVPNPDDGRSWLIEPTADGMTATNAAIREVEAVDRGLFRRLRNPAAFHAELLAFVAGAD